MNPIHPTVVWLTWRQIFANRRLYLALLFSLAPLGIALVFRSLTPDLPGDSRGFYLILGNQIIIGVILPLAALVFGTTAFGGELDDGTLLYLLVKPVARWRIVFSKYVVSVISSFVLMVPAIFLPWLVMDRHDLPIGVPVSLLWGVAVGSILYAAIFTMFGLVIKQSLVVGLMYVVAFEEVLARTVPSLRSFSVREFANATAAHMADPALNLGAPLLTVPTMRNVGGVVLVGALALTIYKLARYQLAERV
jgi:ABC-2 type transport system permease protein